VRQPYYNTDRSILSRNFGKSGEALGKIFIRRDIISHRSVVVLLISYQIEVSCSSKSEEDSLFFTSFLAFQGFIDRCANSMAALRSGKDPFDPCELLGCLEELEG